MSRRRYMGTWENQVGAPRLRRQTFRFARIEPLNGRVAIGGEAVARDDTVTFVPSSLVLKPDDMAPLATEKLTVVAKVLNMRRCGDADCAVTGRLEKGVWNVIKVDDKDDWLLVALPDRAGWVSKQFVEMN